MYAEMPWIGPDNKSPRDLVRCTDVLRAGGPLRLTAFFLLTFFFAIFFRVTGRFLLTFFFAIFFRVTGRFLLTLFFLADAFFLLTFFFAIFFRATGRFLRAATFFRDTLRFLATFLREVATCCRFLLAVFFAGISNSCRIEKRAGLYIACANMEAYFQGFLGDPSDP
ncbi:MAG: hypothetical protein IIA78_03255 [Proteobacteria bacterium]|nr:hypothetical protein [Pseudomonadota bacterium]